MYSDSFKPSGQNPNVSVDCVIFGFKEGDLKVLLIERTKENNTAPITSELDLLLPGDLVFDNEDLDTSAKRVLKELTNLENIFLEQFYTFGNPNRLVKSADKNGLASIKIEPQARVITIAYYSLVKLDDFKPTASSFARKADWYSLKQLPALGFDHNEIVTAALKALKKKIQTHPIGFELLPLKFTLSQLQKLYETVIGNTLDKRNFRRQFIKKGILKPLMEKQKHVPHKRAQLFEFDKDKYELMNKEDYQWID
jgi:8-oxo-dGTP diphosphatase